MGSPFGNNIHTKVFVSLVLIGTVLSATASILMLTLIHRLKRKNGHVLLVTTMTVFTLLYDITFFPGIVNLGNDALTIFANTMQLFTGISSSLTSNLIAWVTFYVVTYRTTIDIFANFHIMFLFITLPAIIDCIIFLLSLQNEHSENLADIATLQIYYYLKLVSIAANFLFFGLTAYEIRRIASKKHVLSKHEQALNALSMRLFYYPILQSISRSGCAWYEFQYADNPHSHGQGFDLNPPHTNNEQFAAQVVMALTMPVGSIGYLIIFLIMQPKAYREFKKLCHCWNEEDAIAEEKENEEKGVYSSSFDVVKPGFHLSNSLTSLARNNNNLEEEEGWEEDRSSASYESASHLRFSLLQSVDEERSTFS